MATWRDWLIEDGLPVPDESLWLSRDQVIAAAGVCINGRTMRFWEEQSLIPKPVRKWRRGATRSGYPPWMPQFMEWFVDYPKRDRRAMANLVRAKIREYASSELIADWWSGSLDARTAAMMLAASYTDRFGRGAQFMIIDDRFGVIGTINPTEAS